MKLTDTQLRNIKSSGAAQKFADGGGLYLYLSSTGSKLWRLDYRFAGKRKTLSLGPYPAVSLKDARQRREAAKEQLANGIDPGEQKREAKVALLNAEREKGATFEAVAREWYAKKTAAFSPGHRKKILARLEKQLFPHIGSKQFNELEPSDILAAISHAERRGAIETAHRLAQLAGQVSRYARLVGHTKYNVAAGLSEALPSVPTKHYAAITDPNKVGSLLRAIDEYQGDLSIKFALQLLPYLFVRSGELRGAEWQEVNLASAEWIIPAGRMKMKRPHFVPLATQVVAMLQELQELTGHDKYLFPSPYSASRPISDMGLLNALRRMGYGQEEMTIHGFRGMASTLLNEQGYRPDVIEAQLAHGEKNAIRAAYNHAEYFLERRQMMQEWADYLDRLKINSPTLYH